MSTKSLTLDLEHFIRPHRQGTTVPLAVDFPSYTVTLSAIPILLAQAGFAASTVIEETPEAPTQSEMTKFFFACVNEKDNLFLTGPREREATRRHTLSGLT